MEKRLLVHRKSKDRDMEPNARKMSLVAAVRWWLRGW